MNLSMNITGGRELQTKLQALGSGYRRVARRAMEQAVTIQLQAAKAELKASRTGLLRKSLGKKIVTYSNGAVVGLVGPRTGFKTTARSLEHKGRRVSLVGTRQTRRGPKTIKLRASSSIAARIRKGQRVYLDPVMYAHLVEGGARPHAIGKGSTLRKRNQRGQQHPGAKAQPFLRPARDRTQAQVIRAVGAFIAARLTKEAA